MLGAFATADFGVTPLQLIGSAILYALFILVPAGLAAFSLNFLLSIPMRRRERARFFIDLLETALQRGDSPERLLVDMAASRDRAPGVRFHILAAYLEEGLRLDRALEKVPRLVPPPVAAILKAGQQLGNLQRVLPACRQVLADSHSDVRSAGSYMVVLLLTLSPLAVWVSWLLFIFVLPKFKEIMGELDGVESKWLAFVSAHPFWVIGPQTIAFLALIVAAFFYLGGPRVISWVQFGVFPAADWIAWKIPWKHHRLQRTFSVMLSTLLDGGVPEGEAVKLAAQCTANEIVRRRADRVVAALARGEKLADAISALDRHGEFRWRLKNGAFGGTGSFVRALNGWHEALEARAFREEQTAAHLTTTAMVLLNGLLVAAIALATFGSLIAILNAGVLW
jgi:type II secretory pathway component PulF